MAAAFLEHPLQAHISPRTDVERIARVEGIITHVLEGCAMKAIPSGLRDHVHYSAHRAAKLSFRVVADNLKLLNQIDVRNHYVSRPTNVGVDDAIKEIKLRTVFLSMKRRIGKTRTGNSNVSFDPADVSVLRSRDGRCAWRKG